MAVALAACLLTTSAARAETGPEKPRSTRKIFDLTPPRPGEILINPARGNGSAPRLEEFAPSTAMHSAQDEAGERVAGSQSAQGSAGDGSSANSARPAAAGPPVRPSDLQKQLSEEVAKLGIEGFLSQRPQMASTQDRQYWDRTRQEIATSLANWQALYAPSAENPKALPAAPSSPQTGDEPKR